MNESKKIGIALSGGGARAIAHLGCLYALEELGIRPSIISGTSAGAIAGAIHSKGIPLPHVKEFFMKTDFVSVWQLLYKKQGFFSMQRFKDMVEHFFPVDDFSALKIPLYVAATDLIKGKTKYFNSGCLSDALLASSCVPLLFQPMKIEDSYYVDGGVINNFPVEPLIGQCDFIIGSHVNAITMNVDRVHFKDVLDRSLHFAIGAEIRTKALLCDVFIEPPDMSRFHIFDNKKFDEIFDCGYEHTLSLKEKLIGF